MPYNLYYCPVMNFLNKLFSSAIQISFLPLCIAWRLPFLTNYCVIYIFSIVHFESQIHNIIYIHLVFII